MAEQPTQHSELPVSKGYGSSTEELDSYGFIVGSNVDQQTIDRADLIAAVWGVYPHEVLLSLGWIAPEVYVAKLAATFRVGHAFTGKHHRHVRFIDATSNLPSHVADEIEYFRQFSTPICLTSPFRPEATLSADQRSQMVHHSVGQLRSEMPSGSAATRTAAWQVVFCVSILGSLIGATLVDRWLSYFLLVILTAIPFAFVVSQRLIALIVFWRNPLPKLAHIARFDIHATPSTSLPVYSVLVPLFHEADVLRDILDALVKLKYPPAKLDVILILEETDALTQRAISGIDLPGFVKVLIVPDLQPRTKPKALDYAMQFTSGEFIVVYDAEDVPEPNQLRKALQVFAQHPDIDCLQARLNIHNASENWLTAQFALEYTTLFDGLLPALERLGLPIPLGGTSNHFRRHTLLASGLWDPYNVTEDADLGLRLERQGRKIGILDSTTWEEAPADLGNWIRQRTRWIKGWMQTYLVHMRNPLVLQRELGLAKFIGM